jgi:hypothetical protein
MELFNLVNNVPSRLNSSLISTTMMPSDLNFELEITEVFLIFSNAANYDNEKHSEKNEVYSVASTQDPGTYRIDETDLEAVFS